MSPSEANPTQNPDASNPVIEQQGRPRPLVGRVGKSALALGLLASSVGAVHALVESAGPSPIDMPDRPETPLPKTHYVAELDADRPTIPFEHLSKEENNSVVDALENSKDMADTLAILNDIYGDNGVFVSTRFTEGSTVKDRDISDVGLGIHNALQDMPEDLLDAAELSNIVLTLGIDKLGNSPDQAIEVRLHEEEHISAGAYGSVYRGVGESLYGKLSSEQQEIFNSPDTFIRAFIDHLYPKDDYGHGQEHRKGFEDLAGRMLQENGWTGGVDVGPEPSDNIDMDAERVSISSESVNTLMNAFEYTPEVQDLFDNPDIDAQMVMIQTGEGPGVFTIAVTDHEDANNSYILVPKFPEGSGDPTALTKEYTALLRGSVHDMMPQEYKESARPGAFAETAVFRYLIEFAGDGFEQEDSPDGFVIVDIGDAIEKANEVYPNRD